MLQKPDSSYHSFMQSPLVQGNLSKLFSAYRKKTAFLILRPMSLAVFIIAIWLVIVIDPLLYPDFLELHYGRIAICLICIVVFILSYVSKLKEYVLELLLILYFAILNFYSIICGAVIYDHTYFSGLQIVVVIAMFIPASLITMSVFYVISLIVLFISFSVYHPHHLLMQEYFIMNNLAFAYAIGSISFFIMNRYRLALFIKQLEMEEMATTDALTKVSNRRFFLSIMEREYDQNKRYSKPLSLIMMMTL